jgi:hypothetical protein
MERIVVGKSKLVYHNVCLTCSECKLRLNQTNSDTTKVYAYEPPISCLKDLPQGAIYCQRCHLEKFQEQAVRPCIWTDSSAIKGSAEKGCPRCGGAVFQAEEIIENGASFHKKCFTCFTCTKPLNDKLQVCIGFDQEMYCKTCCPTIKHTPLPMDPQDRSKVKARQGDPEACPRCFGKVFDAECKKAKGRFYHNQCFTCQSCSHILDVSTVYEAADDIFCRTCYVEKNFTGGRNYFLDSTKAVKTENDNDPDACVKCRNKAFDNERVMARSGPFHKSCLACYGCSRPLDASSFNDGRDGGVYCKGCYSVKYGLRSARSQSRGAATTENVSAIFPAGEGDLQCPSCQGKVFDAEKLVTQFGPYHVACLKCSQCQKSLSTSPAYKLEGSKIACKSCMEAVNKDMKGHQVIAKALVETDIIKAVNDTDPDCCPRCKGKVFEAEKMSMRVGSYHKKCFSCSLCHRNLDFSIASDGPDDILCTNCYRKNFGPTVANTYHSFSESGKIKPSKNDRIS